ncbi:MAG: AAA family ATPase [Clostridia bacterium]|jgi:hypothetical protein
MNTIRPVLEKIYKNEKVRKRCVPIFMGNPGLGKTYIINEFVDFCNKNKTNFVDFFGTAHKEYNPKSVQYIASQVSPLEVSGIGMPDKELKQMVYYNYHKLASLKPGDVLFFDELPNANPAVLNALLTVIEDRRLISGDTLPDIMIIAAGNRQGCTPMTPQMKRRFIWYNVQFNRKMYKDFLYKEYKIPDIISIKLCNLIESETFTDWNFYTPADIDKAILMILDDIPTPYTEVIRPILQTLIQNKTGKQVKINNDRILEPDETIPWLEMVQLSNNK